MIRPLIMPVIAAVLASALTVLAMQRLNPVAVSEQQPTDASNGTELVTTMQIADQQSQEVIALGLEVDDLRTALDLAREERSQLVSTVTDMSRQLADVESTAINLAARASQSDELNLADTGTLSNDNDADARSINNGFFANEPTADERLAGLLAAGVSPDVAQDIERRRDQFQLRRLELTDLASRGGWLDSDDYRQQLQQLREERVNLRDELGESAYDQYLFESGNTNRVVVQSIISGSAAQIAGVETGDVVFRYADQRVYRVRELQAATRDGSRGELVLMQLYRAGQTLLVEIPRGPLGVTLSSRRDSPL